MPDIADALFLDDQNSEPIGEKFVVFTLGDELFAISADEVSEVIQPLDITSLPNIPDWILGITSLRGEIVSVIHLPKLWQIPTLTKFPKPKLIILRQNNLLIALAADKLNEMVFLTEDSIQPCEKNSYFIANTFHNNKSLQIINTQKLFSKINSVV